MKAFLTYVTARPTTKASSLFSATASLLVAVAVSFFMVALYNPTLGHAAHDEGRATLTTSATSTPTNNAALSTTGVVNALGNPVAEGTTFVMTVTMPLVQTGNFTVEDDKSVQKASAYTISAANKTAIKNRLTTQLAKPTSSGTGIKVDLLDLAIPTALTNNVLDSKTTTNAISPIATEVINENPDFFYISNRLSVGYGYSGGKWTVSYIQTYYSVEASKIASMRTSFSTAITNAIKWIPANGTDYQKAKAAHDWLVRNCAYNTVVNNYLKSGNSSPATTYQNTYGNLNPWTAYGALVEKKPVCEGYSLAFIAMMSKANIDADFVISGDESHGWNRAKLANKWYHLDITWDDPIPDQGSGVSKTSTTWFAKSDTYMKGKGGVHASWKPASPACNDKAYDSTSTNWPDYNSNASGGNQINPNAKSISGCTLTLSKTNCIYDGTAQKPVVTLKDGTTTLRNNTDYTVTYANNTNVGTATVTVTGKGSYTGTKSTTFTIKTTAGVQLTASNTSASFAAATNSSGTNRYSYTGQTIKPALTLKYGSTTLVAGTDYIAVYPGETKNGITNSGSPTTPGTKSVIIKPYGKYLDGKTFTISYYIISSISDPRVSITSPAAVTYNGSAQKKAATVKHNGVALKEGTDFTITYPSDCTSVGTKICTIIGKGAFSGTGTYSYSIKQAAISSATITMATSANYTGSQVKPAVKATMGGTTLKSGTDYTVAYSNNIKPGKATAIISGKGNLSGTTSKSFTINQPTIAVYWIVNKKTGENLYTTAWNEVNTLCNKKKTWTNKGIMWNAPASGTAVYRLVNKKTGDHHFTMDTKEVRQLTKVRKTWQADFSGKPVFYSGGTKPIYRLYSESRWKANKAGTHRFATSLASANSLRSSGWANEGIKLYAVK